MPSMFGEVDLTGPQQLGQSVQSAVERSFKQKTTLYHISMDAARRAQARRVSLGYAQAVQNATTADEVVKAASSAMGSLTGLADYGDEATKAVQKDADMRLKVLAPDKSITLGDIAMQRAREAAALGKAGGKTVAELAHEYYLQGQQGPYRGTKTVDTPTGAREVAFEVPSFKEGGKATTVDIGPRAPDEAAARQGSKDLTDLGEKAAIATGKLNRFKETFGEEKLKTGQAILDRILSPEEQKKVEQSDQSVETIVPDIYERIAREKMDPTATSIFGEMINFRRTDREVAGLMQGLKQKGYTLEKETSKLIKLSDITPAEESPQPRIIMGRHGARNLNEPSRKKVGRFTRVK